MSTVAIKIKAFIPDATIPHPNPLAGSTFDGDNRGFSFDGSYRIAQYIKVDLDDLEVITNMAMTGTTCENTADGKKCGKAGTNGIKVEGVKIENNILYFKAVGAASNPLLVYARPDLDYEMHFSVRKNGRVCVAGGHDGFPNYEVWVQKNNETPESLYKYSYGNEKAWSLGGSLDKGITEGTCT